MAELNQHSRMFPAVPIVQNMKEGQGRALTFVANDYLDDLATSIGRNATFPSRFPRGSSPRGHASLAVLRLRVRMAGEVFPPRALHGDRRDGALLPVEQRRGEASRSGWPGWSDGDPSVRIAPVPLRRLWHPCSRAAAPLEGCYGKCAKIASAGAPEANGNGSPSPRAMHQHAWPDICAIRTAYQPSRTNSDDVSPVSSVSCCRYGIARSRTGNCAMNANANVRADRPMTKPPCRGGALRSPPPPTWPAH